MLADDQQFFLMVQLCYAKLLLVNTPRRGFISFGRHRILKHNLVDLLRQHSHTFDKAYEDLMRAVIDCNKSSNLRANYRFDSPATAQFSLTFSPFPIEDYTGKENVGKNDLNPGTIGSQIGVALPFQEDKEGQLSDRDVVNCHILLIEVANFTNTFSHFTACPSFSPEGSSVSDGNCWLRSVEDKDGIQTPNMMSLWEVKQSQVECALSSTRASHLAPFPEKRWFTHPSKYRGRSISQRSTGV
ncbi:hypothetical protein Nepgr_029743 [Nepenthes gracilis]|uniref:Uncharacterized protein n=1 Tax=Nepenthes gracilis TaxID=150966 RepID=A0AAD3Y549_NEPGR|nr:hypothetical protein Nepgr_029743 [Nepenthes gracilis]